MSARRSSPAASDWGYELAPLNAGDTAMFHTEIRNNGRVLWDDKAFANNLYHRVRTHLPAKLEGRPLLGLNERVRFYRYQQGESFAPHHDFPFERNAAESSALTLMIYLNEGFTGGSTDFFRDDQTRLISVQPRTGMGLVFRHEILHAGTPVTAGRKYVLRTDVMYGAKGLVI